MVRKNELINFCKLAKKYKSCPGQLLLLIDYVPQAGIEPAPALRRTGF